MATVTAGEGDSARRGPVSGSGRGAASRDDWAKRFHDDPVDDEFPGSRVEIVLTERRRLERESAGHVIAGMVIRPRR
jgi:hypothetical protein